MNHPENQLLQEIEDAPHKVSYKETEGVVLKMPYEFIFRLNIYKK